MKTSPLLLITLLCNLANSQSAQDSSVGQTAIVSVERANVLVGDQIVGVVPKGQELLITDKQGPWLGVTWKNEQGQKSGWIAQDQTTVKPLSAPTKKPDEITQKKDTSQSEVFITKTGTKYHKAGCRYLSKSKLPISLQEAESHYGPCSVCYSPVSGSQERRYQAPTLTTDGSEKNQGFGSGRCQATTQKGAQCKRSAQPGRNFCWQH